MYAQYNDEFKKQVVQEYMKDPKSTIEIAPEYNIAKSIVSQWAKNIVRNANIEPNQMKLSQQKK